METTVLEVGAADGRRIEVMHTDLSRDAVVVSHGGTPSGLAEWPWFDELAAAAGLGLVAFNRPGYGASDRRAEPRVAGNADDTACVLDHLGVDAFVSLGTSGGGPYALADGARLRGRCRGVVVVGGLGPADADGLDFTDGMGEANLAVFGAACAGRHAVTPIAEMYATMMSAVTAASLTEFADSLFPPVDAAVFRGPHAASMTEFFAAMTVAAFSSGPAGFEDDMVALTTPWGFELGAVQAPVVVWHGELDENVPIAHGRWIADNVASAERRFRPEHGHMSILTELPAIIDDVGALAR